MSKKDIATHLKHCNQGEYEDSCKYGEADCPALTAQNPQALATGIVRMAQAAQDMMDAGLTERAMILLVADYTGQPLGIVKQILRALPKLTHYVDADKFYKVKR